MSRKIERQFLCASPKSKQIMKLLEAYIMLSEDGITLLEDNYAIYYLGHLSSKCLNELRMYALGCYDTLCYLKG